MIECYLSEIARIVNAEWIGEDRIIKTVTIDSTKITEQCMFIALQGTRFDGHDFANQAFLKGADALLVNRYLKLEIPQLIVVNTKYALFQLAAWVRRQVSSKVIAITGSSGKTSVKEMIVSILSHHGNIVATTGNFNNEIGVSLTLLRLTHSDDFAVIELGANHFGEISHMSRLVHPDIVLINNIFSAHLSGFDSLVGVAAAKGEIFSNLSDAGICVLNADNNAWFFWRLSLLDRMILSFSIYRQKGVDFFATNVIYCRDNINFILHTPHGHAAVTLSILGMHSVSNALAASALAFSVGATLNEIVSGLEKFCALPGRLFPIMLGRSKLLLDDTYNANVGSMLAAIHVLRKMVGYRVIVVGDMSELGVFTEIEHHKNIGIFISQTNIHKVLSIGCLSGLVSYFSRRGEHFGNHDMLIIRLMNLFYTYEKITVLIKGSRSMLMDQLVIILREQLYDSWIN